MQVKSTANDLAAQFNLGSADGTAARLATRGADFASLLRQKQTLPVSAPPPMPAPTPVPPQPVAAPPAPQAAAGPKPSTTRSSATDKAGDGAPADDAAAADAPAAASTEPAATATDAADAPPSPADAARWLARLKTRGADAGAAAKSAKAGPADAAGTAAPDAEATTEKAKPKATPEAQDPTLAGALPAGLPQPPAVPARRDATAAGGEARAGADADRAAPRRADPLGARQDAAAQDPAAVAMAATTSLDAQAAVSASPDFAALLADSLADTSAVTLDDPREATRSSAVDGVGAAAPLAGSLAPVPTSGPSAAQPVDVPTRVDSPDFAQHLGVQLSVLAKDGVQHAELHLNPADMGPVSVQITLDGAQARVDFGADVAATRQALEAGLPQLAGALADAGFTLAGGGVSQHAAGNGDGRGNGADTSASGDGGRGGRSRSGEAVDPAGVRNAARRNVRIGGLDLYA